MDKKLDDILNVLAGELIESVNGYDELEILCLTEFYADTALNYLPLIDRLHATSTAIMSKKITEFDCFYVCRIYSIINTLHSLHDINHNL